MSAGISTSSTSSREPIEQKIESLFTQVKYLQDQFNGRAAFVGMTGDKFPGGLTQGSVVSKPVSGGLMFATVGKNGRVDASVTLDQNSTAFGGFVTSISIDTVPQGKFVIYETTGPLYDIYVNNNGTPTGIGDSNFGNNTLARRDSSGKLVATGFNAQASGTYSVNGQYVVRERQPAIADSAAASFPAVNTKINEILNMLRTGGHGLIFG